MKRIAIIGCSGSGKSTLAFELERITGLPVLHLDKIYWKSGWQESDIADFRAEVQDLCNGDEWIFDGNYFSTMEIRLNRADTVFFLDYSTSRCFLQTMKRIIAGYGKDRPDCAEGCPNDLNLDFLMYILNFRRVFRHKIIDLFARHKHLKLHHFTHPRELKTFMKTEIKNYL
ncbi:MAG: P-loop NTPase family protein [Planctomycetota bacterium]|jgi:adenylate kinase family enzyme